MSGERRLAAIMFTDLVGYTRLAQADESLALELLEEHRALLRPTFPAHGGTEVKTIGDAFLVEFKSALDAVLCAVELQKKMAERNLGPSGPRKLELRVGIHLGDVVHGSGDVYGDAVNVASRIEPLAEPGGICITQQVYDHIRNKSELEFSKLGEIELKNVELPVGVYKVIMSWNAQSREEGRAPRERLAVLPFVNISPDPDDEYFADGLTEELISKFSEVGQLKVIARTSVMNYKKKEKKASEIGRELGVGSIVEGSVRKAGTRIRVTVQLIDARTEEHIWASNYDKELDDIFAIQSDVASRVAGSISAKVFPAPQRKDTDDAEAYTMYIRAMQLFHESTEPSLREALALFERAVSRDPKFVRAYAGISNTIAKLTSAGYEDFKVIPRAETAARRALELDPSSADGHAALSVVHSLLDRFAQSVFEAEEALKINPNLSEAYISLGIQYAGQGLLVKGLANFQRSYDLDPLAFGAGNFVSLVLRTMGRIDEAVEVMNRMKELNPKNPRVYTGLAECYMMRRDFTKAQEMLDIAKGINPTEPILLLNQGVLFALTDRRNEAEDVLRTIQIHDSESVRLYGELFIYAALGDLDDAMKALMRQAETHSWPFLMKTLPIFEDLRKDSRYADFCTKVGIEP